MFALPGSLAGSALLMACLRRLIARSHSWVLMAESARAGLSVHQFAPARVKRCVTGNGAAPKEVVGAMMLRLLQLEPGRFADQPADATDALAVAWTRLEERRSPLRNMTEA